MRTLAMCRNATGLGYGDMVPVGSVRLLTAAEALNGLVLLGWSVSFTYLIMQRYWTELAELAPE